MRCATTLPSSADGSILPLVLVALGAIGLLALAGYDAARFGLQGARTQVAATAALHAADSGLELYLRGLGAVDGPLAVEAPPGRATVTVAELVALGDSARVVRVVATGRARRGPGPAVERRLGILAIVDTAGGRQVMAGSWRELF